ncbi:polysaccharide lyase 6 family protein [Fulvivirga lutimaris]|uniref:polysaccharide lyase 6 family protein n=1 Tax=Fulvivirga lutimaris TaxID=1819566 RepID=UPI0012BD5BDD|nr:polysaccharide lyase 6 family protein [Fulvivirga lutimaris]MTI40104.1 alginate lyase [Fulvivirga lutimaris]
MTFKKLSYFFVWFTISTFFSCTQEEKGILVNNISEFNQAVPNLKPGDNLILADGKWENVELKLIAKGTAEAPIIMRAQTPGKVIISGQSNLRISGEYIVASDLVFKDGFTPTSEVIALRTSKEALANHTRITNCVIDGFNNPERFDADTWVSIYGKNNQFDHNTLINKGNQGVTFAIKMNTEASQENGHIVEYNYFGPRQVLGSNGGETVRIGTSHYSRKYSNSIVRKNYFDRCNGEHEIISNKSCGNEFRDNVFFESQGTLTMRHGHHTLVENNYFLGNRKPNTGGIRIINEYQTVKNNYMAGLTGYRFRGALVIMNGVPNSPINRYNQVVDSKMEGNIVVDSDYIQLCAGSDEERSAVPVGTTFKDNIIMGKTNLTPFTIYDDVSGIEFSGNIMNEEATLPLPEGFTKVEFSLSRNENGLRVPSQPLIEKAGFESIKLPVSKDETGANYYPKNDITTTFGSGKMVQVAPGENTIIEALETSQPGDVLELENGGEYLLTKYAFVNHTITIRAKEGSKALIKSEKSSFFKIENGGALLLDNILVDGAESPDQAGNNVISTSKYSMNQNYALVVKNCEVKDLDKNHTFDFLKIYKNTFADSIQIINSNFKNVTGSILILDTEVEDLGIYNVENVAILDSKFEDVQGSIANIYRGGTDESTFGPITSVKGVEITNSGKGKRNKIGAVLRFHGVQTLIIDSVQISDSKGVDLFMTNGEPITKVSNVTFTNSAGLKTNGEPYDSENIVVNNK